MTDKFMKHRLYDANYLNTTSTKIDIRYKVSPYSAPFVQTFMLKFEEGEGSFGMLILEACCLRSGLQYSTEVHDNFI